MPLPILIIEYILAAIALTGILYALYDLYTYQPNDNE